MPDPIVCPDCGQRNPPGATSCERCNFPLAPRPEPPPSSDAGNAAASEAPVPAEGAPSSSPESEPPILIRRPRRRPRPRAAGQLVSLWLLFGAFAAMALIGVAIKVNVDRQQQPIEGAREDQQKRADAIRAGLAKDSTNVKAHVELANILYDTGNWPDAIVHYRAALRRDSSLTEPLVDLGVCYFNLSDSEEAERDFLLALKRDPHHPIALFNLGILNERRENYAEAVKYFHRAMQSSPPEEMQQPLVEAIKRIQQRTGKSAPPLPQ